MKMRHDSWHPASISSTPASCGAAKIRAQKRCLYRHQWINVAQAAVQDWRKSGKWEVGGGGGVCVCVRCQLKGWTPAPCGDRNVQLKVRKIRRAPQDCWRAETLCLAALPSETLESPMSRGDQGFWTLLNFLGCLKRTCNLMQRQRGWATGQPVRCWG